jgi:hydrogenase-4 component B
LSADLIAAAAVLWALAALLSLLVRIPRVTRVLLALGCVVAVAGCLVALPQALGGVSLRISLASQAVIFALPPAALWLFGFGLVPAAFACWLGSPLGRRPGIWTAGAAFSLLGALGVFGLQDVDAGRLGADESRRRTHACR